jgi:hypothetical protein
VFGIVWIYRWEVQVQYVGACLLNDAVVGLKEYGLGVTGTCGGGPPSLWHISLVERLRLEAWVTMVVQIS